MPSQNPASLILQHLALGRIYAPQGNALPILIAAMQAKHSLRESQVVNAFYWCVKQELVSTERNTEGITVIEVTNKYHPPRDGG